VKRVRIFAHPDCARQLAALEDLADRIRAVAVAAVNERS